MKGILFNTDMVQAILEGRKTQTRRELKLQKGDFEYIGLNDIGRHLFARMFLDNWVETIPVKPRYQTGDILYVRETYYAYGIWKKLFDAMKRRDVKTFIDLTEFDGSKYQYADNPPDIVLANKKHGIVGWFKRPSLFMPKSAARIFLEVIGIRCERLGDISEQDAIGEGIEKVGNLLIWSYKDYLSKETRYSKQITATESFHTLWESINKSYNPDSWVFVYDFKRIEKPEPK